MISHLPLKYLWRCCISCWEKLESYHYLSEEFKCCKISFVAGKIKCSMLDDKVNGLNTRVKLARSCQYVVMPSMLLMHQLISLFIKKETVMKLLLRKSTGFYIAHATLSCSSEWSQKRSCCCCIMQYLHFYQKSKSNFSICLSWTVGISCLFTRICPSCPSEQGGRI